MTQNQTQDMMKQAINIMNGDYKTPGKLLLWAMALGQWMVIIFFGGVLLLVFLYFIFSLVGDHQKNTALTQNAITIKEQYIEKEFTKINNITEFLELKINSTNDRQNILESLIKIIHLPITHKLDQAALEHKVKSLSVGLTNCNISKEKYKKIFSKAIKYFEIPNSSKEFKQLMGKLIVDRTSLERQIEDSSKEGERWESLCLLYQGELSKAQYELTQDLNAEVNVQK